MKVQAHQILEILALAALVAGILVPSAAANAQRPDDRAGVRGPGAVSTHTAIRPDDRSGLHGVGQVASPQAVTVPLRSTGGFEWNAAALGAGAALMLGLLAAGMALGARRVRQLRMP